MTAPDHGGSTRRPRVVVVGGGFGGLEAAKRLSRQPVDVVVVDRRNFHLFQPLLYQVATAALAAPDIARPIRKILEHPRNVTVYMAEVTAVDAPRKTLTLADGTLPYDYLVLAPGAVDHYFGHDEWADHAPGLKSIGDALEIRRRILSAFEEAERTTDPARRKACLTFVVVGGGPTGVETAGALGEIARHTLARDFRHFDPRDAVVILVEAHDRILPGYPSDLSEKAAIQLRRFGVEIKTGVRVTEVGAAGVRIDREWIPARTVIWAAGVRASPLVAGLGVPMDPGGRVMVDPDLSVPGHPEVFVVGDAAMVSGAKGPVPGVAPAAMQMGRRAAENIGRAIRGLPTEPFHYVDKGSLATIGRRAGVADFGRLHFSGTIAWFMWLFVHLFFLIGFRNRVVVMFEWALAYVTYQRSASVIITERRPPRRSAAGGPADDLENASN